MRAKSESERQEAIYSGDWLTPEQAGRAAGDIGADTILAAIHGGELRAMDVSRPSSKRSTFKIRRDWLEAWVEARTVNSEAA